MKCFDVMHPKAKRIEYSDLCTGGVKWETIKKIAD